MCWLLLQSICLRALQQASYFICCNQISTPKLLLHSICAQPGNSRHATSLHPSCGQRPGQPRSLSHLCCLDTSYDPILAQGRPEQCCSLLASPAACCKGRFDRVKFQAAFHCSCLLAKAAATNSSLLIDLTTGKEGLAVVASTCNNQPPTTNDAEAVYTSAQVPSYHPAHRHVQLQDTKHAAMAAACRAQHTAQAPQKHHEHADGLGSYTATNKVGVAVCHSLAGCIQEPAFKSQHKPAALVMYMPHHFYSPNSAWPQKSSHTCKTQPRQQHNPSIHLPKHHMGYPTSALLHQQTQGAQSLCRMPEYSRDGCHCRACVHLLSESGCSSVQCLTTTAQ
jgi:hypothetical protein